MKTNATVAGMRAVLEEADVVFCTTTDEAGAAKVQPTALGPFGEAEGLSMILARDAAEALRTRQETVAALCFERGLMV